MNDSRSTTPDPCAQNLLPRLSHSGRPLRRHPHEPEAHFLLRARVCELMRQLGLTLKATARALRIHPSTLRASINRGQQLPPAWLAKLAACLGTTRDALLEGLDWRPRRCGAPRRDDPRFVPRPPKPRTEPPSHAAVRQRLCALMESQGLTHRTVARALRVHRTAVSLVIQGRMQLPPAWLQPLSAMLNTTPQHLVEGTQWVPRRAGKPNKHVH